MNSHRSSLVSPCPPPSGVACIDDAPVERAKLKPSAPCLLSYADIARIIVVNAALAFACGVIFTTIFALLTLGGPR